MGIVLRATPDTTLFRKMGEQARSAALLFLVIVVVCLSDSQAAAGLCRDRSRHGLVARNSRLVATSEEAPGEIGDKSALARAFASCGRAPLNGINRSGQNRSVYIMNGQDQVYGEWPSFVRVIHTRGGMQVRCGGVLVSSTKVLTAAHCVLDEMPDGRGTIKEVDGFRVYLADHSLDGPDRHETSARVAQVCTTTSFEFRHMQNDWAVLDLARPVPFSSHIQPACLPYAPVATSGPAATCFVVGAGSNYAVPDEAGRLITRYPRVVQKLRVSKIPCGSELGRADDEARECYGSVDGRNRDSCVGDSGGPVLCLDASRRWTLVALVSYGPYCDTAMTHMRPHGVYTRLTTLIGRLERICPLR